MASASPSQRLRYTFDNAMSSGPRALIGALAALTAAMIVGVTLLLLAARLAPPREDGAEYGFVELLYRTLLRTLDPGTVSADEGGWPFLLSMLAVTLGGIFVVSTLIGLLTTGIDAKLSELRKGRSFVVEHDHTLILGWSDQVFVILSELAIAGANQRRPRAVILAERDKVEMEDAIRERLGRNGRLRVVCRSGSPISLDDLAIANPQAARSIIVLSPQDDDPDAQVIKTVLALRNDPRRRAEPYHIVAEVRDPRNLEAARLVGGEETVLVDVGETVSRLIVRTSRQSGLSVVYTELLDFKGSEIYFDDVSDLVGQTFGDALLAYEDAAVIGVHAGDGEVLLGPPSDRLIAVGEEIVVIAEDDEPRRVPRSSAATVDEAAIQTPPRVEPRPERVAVLGWNRRAPVVLSELDAHLAPGSEVCVLADHTDGDSEITRCCPGLSNLEVSYHPGDTTERRTLDALELGSFDHVIVLSEFETRAPQRADARTLVTLCHLRDLEEKIGERFSVVSEMLDDRNRQLAQVTKADDFIVSDKLVSLLLTQISENRHLKQVFAELFDGAGSEVHLKPAHDYVAPGRATNFCTVVEAARRRGEVAFGLRLGAHAEDPERDYGVLVNPSKSAPFAAADGDRVLVLAER